MVIITIIALVVVVIIIKAALEGVNLWGSGNLLETS